jgi:hypothetical protein
MRDDLFKDEVAQASAPNRGWNFLGCLVVGAIVLILIGMILPVLDVSEKPARQMQCGKNQAQILGAMVAYATSEETAWPDPRGTTTAAWKLPTVSIATALDGAKYTAGAFELIAASQSVPNSLFKCPGSSFGGPSKRIKASLDTANVQWGWDPANHVAVSYAFDWASPPDPSSARAILADREGRAHRDSIMVTFGDAHVKAVELVEVSRGTKALVTASALAGSRKTGTAVQPGDDIFTTEGDGGEPLTPGKGDPLRAWVK